MTTIGLRLLQFSTLTLCVLAAVRGEAQAPVRTRSGSACGAPFTPSAKLKSARVVLPDTAVSVNLPLGWSARQAIGQDGSPYFLVNAPPAGPSGMVLLAASDAEQGKSLEQVIQETGDNLTHSETGRVTATQKFSLQQACGLQVVFRTPNAEGYIVAVRTGVRVYIIAAKYPIESSSEMRSGLDTIVATVALPAPASSAAPVAAVRGGVSASSIVGCWDTVSEHRILSKSFSNNGTYESTSMWTGVDMPTRTDVERGSFRLEGNRLTMFPSQGGSTGYNITLERGLLRINGIGYTACGGR